MIACTHEADAVIAFPKIKLSLIIYMNFSHSFATYYFFSFSSWFCFWMQQRKQLLKVVYICQSCH